MTKQQQIQEEEIVRLLSGRSPAGMERIYDSYSSAVYGVILRIVQNDALAEEILQETFLKIWNSISKYKASGGSLLSWTLSMARNAAIDRIKKREYAAAFKNRESDAAAGGTGAAPRHSYNPASAAIKEKADRLEPEHREMIDLIYFKGNTQIEVALKLHIPLGTVKTRTRSAIMKLRKYLE